ncbi:MAG: crotonyl-CoA carboxylase/reductase [Dehalococcoidia bacterium]|nr:crotonyl-CoA carboxylase/reductase [Dehalococcoidia bacterium]
MTASKEVYEIGEAPPPGVVPPKMHAQLIRQSRYGEPRDAFVDEIVDIPSLGPREVLVYVMAAGINYSTVWASLGVPVDVVRGHKMAGKGGDATGFHIGGGDGSGIVYAVGEKVDNVKVGDHVVLHCGMWDEDDPFVLQSNDPMFSNTFRIWGYDSNWGSFAQFTRVQAHQCLPKPPHLSWEESAAFMLDGATAYRMLTGWPPHQVRENDVVLIWGGSGGLGSMAIQITKALGGIPIAVVSNAERGEYCLRLGARGFIDRTRFNHWGRLPDWRDEEATAKAVQGFRAFGRAVWEVLGERRNPRIIFEHPGEDTIPTSMFICDTGGMVVICAGTTGYNADVDLRYLWTRQKRFQGSHFANAEQAAAVNQLVHDGKLDPCLGKVFAYDEIGAVHQLLYENKHPNGNMAILIGAPKPGLK